jgi:hypothetical protein
MRDSSSDFVVLLMMAVFAVIGLYWAGRSVDAEMETFGLSLVAFSIGLAYSIANRGFEQSLVCAPDDHSFEGRLHG